MNLLGRTLRLRAPKAIALFVVLDIFCMGIGMGVPVFNILFGFVVGWYIVRRIFRDTWGFRDMLRRLLIYGAIASGVTFAGMVIIWGPSIVMLWDPHADFVGYGIPQILYEPRVSFIAWLLLMLAISPFLQLLATIFGGHVTLLVLTRPEKDGEKSSDAAD
jgi:hypothetical protein